MSTIKIKTSHAVETEHEIQIPSYYKGIAHAFKIVSPDKCLKVYFGYYKEERGVELAGISQIFSLSKPAEPCTAEEFETIFMEAMVTLGEIAENGIVIENQIETI